MKREAQFRPVDSELKEKALAMLRDGYGQRYVAQKLGLAKSSVHRWRLAAKIPAQKPRNGYSQGKNIVWIALREAWGKEWLRVSREDCSHWKCHPVAIKAAQRIYYRKNRRRIYLKVKANPEQRIRKQLRSRIYNVLKGIKKSAPTLELLGCSLPFLKQWLESRFKGRMSWANYGPYWHIDHIIPCAEFELIKPDEQRRCFHYTNLQPLEAQKNLRKNDSFTVAQPCLLLNETQSACQKEAA